MRSLYQKDFPKILVSLAEMRFGILYLKKRKGARNKEEGTMSLKT